ncbi:MAG: AraC family transcriptional regulator [Pseudomonadota bacterium]
MHALTHYLQSRSATRPMAQEVRSAFDVVTYRTDQLHRHDYFELFLLDEGRGCCVADSVEYRVLPHTVFVIPPGTMHYWKDSDALDGFIARIPLIEGHALLTGTDIRPEAFRVDVDVHPHLLALLRWIVLDDPKDDTRRTPLSRLRWRLLFEALSAEAQKSLRIPEISSPTDISAAFMTMLERKYHLRWGVQDYAKALKVSRSSLLRATQATYGCSPADLIQQRTLKEAERLLATTTQTCAEISETLGYLSQAQFTRAFSGHFKEAPTVYRRKRLLDARPG